MNTRNSLLSLLMLLLVLGGCKKDNAIVDPGIDITTAQIVYVVSEGNYGKANASLTLYVPDSLKTYQDVFASVNNRNLGDVGNDMIVWGSYGYIVVNNSQKIEVVSLDNMKSVGTIVIPGAKSPFNAAILSGTKGYVTNLYDNSVTVFNPTTFAVIKDRIPVGTNPQGIAVHNGKVYVCNSGYGADSTVSVIDPMTDEVVKTIVVGKSPSEIAVDSESKLIVKCDGVGSYPDPQKESAGSIVRIDPATNTVVATLPLPLPAYDHPVKMAVTGAGFAFVKVKGGIMKMSTTTMTVVNAIFIPILTTPAAGNINGMAFDTPKNRLYVADALDYSSAGTVTVYNGDNGSAAASFKAGVIPRAIAFRSTAPTW